MAGTIVANTINTDTGLFSTQNAYQGIAKAWVYFTGSTTPTINGSFNVSSITYVSTAVYTVNMTTAMPNANYAVLGASSPAYGVSYAGAIQMNSNSSQVEQAPTASAFTIWNAAGNATSAANKYVYLAVFSS